MVVFASYCTGHPEGAPPRAVQGRLDLSGWDLNSNDPVPLDGEWLFNWNELAPVAAPGSESGTFVTVPGAWYSYEQVPSRIKPYGCASYHLRIVTDGSSRLLTIKTSEIPIASRVLVDGKPVIDTGSVSCDPESFEPMNYPRTASFIVNAPEFVLTVQVANYRHRIAGIVRSILLGTQDKINAHSRVQLAFDLFLAGSLFIIGLYHLSLFILWRKDRASFWFGIFCILMALRAILMNERAIYAFIPGLPWELEVRIEYCSVTIGAFFVLFTRSLFPDEVKRGFVLVVSAISAVYASLVVLTPANVFAQAVLAYQAIAVSGGAYISIMLIRAAIGKREGGVIILAAYMVFFLSLANDFLHAHMFIHTTFLVPFGLLVLVFAQSYIISMRTAKSYRMVEGFSRQLELYAQQLEERVEERTHELQEERNRLRRQSEIITNEIEMASRIQQRMIPAHPPGDSISVIYLPMKLVGGDFYDFIPLRGPGRIGIFISDVSGHGVPAALITSMIKSIILQAGEHREDPSGLLFHMNALLSGQTAGNFVTAFYAIYDETARRIDYSCAGHPEPIVLNGTSRSRLGGMRTLPMGIMDNAALVARGRHYVNHTAVLEKGSRLVVFTDGLIEAAPHEDRRKVFEENGLDEALQELFRLPHREFMKALHERLAAHRGSHEFEDDVCIICLDV